jgi:hypothetical protein
MVLKRRFHCEVLGQAIPAKKCYRRRGFPRWLIGDNEALMAALRRENGTGVNEG